ncbi:acyltransferase [Oleiphilus messinensis]|uniref:Acyltransferase n=1 Tax=Oleiphilus messinensis TaxID=141451 RepID=A0A1Y0I3S9_9GAMM|nr:1-acyl-sn-glycerol-3-phosphate acyltransferase [Oleiphilus messinensis]ARU55071.1 acyltransferase [Oleiphilus messinensis]
MLRDSLVKLKVPHTLDALSKYYFQLEFMNDEHLALLRNEQAMLVMNHTAFFALECYLLGSHLLRRFPDLNLRTMVWKGFSEGPARYWFRQLGCETASIQTGQQLLSEGKTILIMPEGIDATDVRNRMNHFHTGYLRMLSERNIPIIPIGFHGIDESIPWMVTHNRFLEKKIMKPVNPDFDFLLLPKIPIFRPTKVVFNIGTPIRLEQKALETESSLRETNGMIRDKISALVDAAEHHRQSKIDRSRLNRSYHKVLAGKISYLNKRK